MRSSWPWGIDFSAVCRSRPFAPCRPTAGWVFAETRHRHPDADGRDLVVAMFGDIAAESSVDTLVPAFEKFRPDLVVDEAFDVGAGVAADVLGIPAAAFVVGMFEPAVPVLHATAARTSTAPKDTVPSVMYTLGRTR
jgi:hypothetical protein